MLKLHNASWPGVVGKGQPGTEAFIDLETMLRLTADAEVDGQKFDGIDLFLSLPHVDIDSSDEALERLADKIRGYGLEVGSCVAPIWAGVGGGSAMGTPEERQKFCTQVRKACRIGAQLRKLGIRPHGVIRVDSSCGVEEWSDDPVGNTSKIIATFTEASKIAADYGERLAAEGEICWGGMHSWRWMLRVLEGVGWPEVFGFQADMAHTMLYLLGYNAPEDRILPEDYDWQDRSVLEDGLRTLTSALRPWMIDFHVAQNDGSVKGSGDHDKTGRHCLVDDPNGKLDVAHDALYWLCNEQGHFTGAVEHLCWDGCMFPNECMMNPATWNHILAKMLEVRSGCQ
ncbi:MAG: TIM barrel protein [Planctomycetia bacterium]|nr:TIM barrel protein [Planctomycetia bacterium]MDO5113622.1 TIM barrel protein [Planctomycetia bacterium]